MNPLVTAAVAILAGIGLAIVGNATGVGSLSPMGLAAALLGLMSVRQWGWPLRLSGALLVVLGITSAVVGLGAGSWGWVVLVPGLVVVGAGAAMVWHRRPKPASGPVDGIRPAPQDPWKRLDAGDDPTAER